MLHSHIYGQKQTAMVLLVHEREDPSTIQQSLQTAPDPYDALSNHRGSAASGQMKCLVFVFFCWRFECHAVCHVSGKLFASFVLQFGLWCICCIGSGKDLCPLRPVSAASSVTSVTSAKFTCSTFARNALFSIHGSEMMKHCRLKSTSCSLKCEVPSKRLSI